MTYKERYDVLVRYLMLKVEQEDWHGVSDAANDLREMIAAKPMMQDVKVESSVGRRIG